MVWWKTTISSAWDTKRGKAFRYLLGGQTAGVCVYWLLSLVTSLGIQLGLRVLTTHLKELKQYRGSVSESKTWFSLVTVAAAFLVCITTIAVAMNNEDRSVGFFSGFSEGTAAMYLSFYCLLYLMGHLSLVFAFALDEWALAYLRSVEMHQRQKNEDLEKGKAITSLLRDYEWYYSGRFLSIFAFVVIHQAIGTLPMYWFISYIRGIYGRRCKLFRISLVSCIMIVSVVPYIATWLTVYWVDREYRRLMHPKIGKSSSTPPPSSKTPQTEDDLNGRAGCENSPGQSPHTDSPRFPNPCRVLLECRSVASESGTCHHFHCYFLLPVVTRVLCQ